ncbi:MAG: DUF6888 family protein [Nostoc sp. ChiSLP01]|nr:hypothetical protein [Nostoc sp. CmiSLP01]MDZ8289457.1 hypothetical protein [Nostoc sp. ChiSLP01]
MVNKGSENVNRGYAPENFLFTVETAKERLTIVYVTIEEQTINPTNEQAQTCVRVCQMLSNSFRNVELFRYDDQTGVVFIFANEELQIIVPPNGDWRFLDATEL